jgi:hypothetical protein
MHLQNVCACCFQTDQVGENPKDICFLHVKVLKIVVTRVKYSTSIYINTLNAELNPIYHLLILLGDLTFMGPCIVSIFQYISNKMRRYTAYLYLETALHVSRYK